MSQIIQNQTVKIFILQTIQLLLYYTYVMNLEVCPEPQDWRLTNSCMKEHGYWLEGLCGLMTRRSDGKAEKAGLCGTVKIRPDGFN